MLQNELLGQEIASRLQKLAKPNELEKYTLHVEEMEKIVNLLLSLSARLARAENILKNMPKDGSSEEKVNSDYLSLESRIQLVNNYKLLKEIHL